ncbi:HlyD family efflux transporter periplasmic adaptor subunit [Pannus brasiliensis CCIBt3594]|uniref:HlyD family efflux transporter periplasmic adaptor subunit n=1 Tax=Pannus brasiliensis CCIBt3594 TaxID=1427578 RepID=A0AAW9QWD7_9CHRO
MENLPHPIERDRETNDGLSLPSPSSSREIYGGVASPSLPSPTGFPHPAPALDRETPAWSSPLQTLLDRPPATFPLQLLVGGTIFCIAFGAWAWFAQVEEVGKAVGKLVPEGETYKIQPIDAGKVSRIEVKEGDTVKAGQIIAELDTTLALKEIERLEQSLNAGGIERTRKQGLLEQLNLQGETRQAIADAEEGAARSAIDLARAKLDTTRQLLLEQERQFSAYRARYGQLQALPEKANTRLAQLQRERQANQERIARLEPLAADGAISREMLFQAEQALRDTEQKITLSQLQDVNSTEDQLFQATRSLQDLDTRITENRGELAKTYQEIRQLQAELTRKRGEARAARLDNEREKKQLQLDIAKLDASIADTKTQLAAARTKLKDRYLRSSVEGTVLTLNLKNAGEVLQPGQTVAEIAPKGVPLVLKAELPDREAGFIRQGLSARLKFDAFPYQDYGVIGGKVTTISADSKFDQTRGEVYRLEISLDPKTSRKALHFKPGQTATAEILIRRRRVVDVLLEPFQKLQKDGLTL